MRTMAKIIRLPQDPEAEHQSAFSLSNADTVESLALVGLGLLATIFAIVLIRGFFIKDAKPRRKPAALSTEDYEGVGFGKSAEVKKR